MGSGRRGGARDEPPLPVRDVVVVRAKGGGLLALSVTDGKERWRAEEVDAGAGFVSVADRMVVGVDKGGALCAFVASTGRSVWRSGSDAAAVLASDGTRVYLVTKENEVRAVDAWTLATAWTRPMTSPRSPNGPARALVGEGRLVIHGRDGRAAALHTETGEKAWEFTGHGTGGQFPSLSSNIVYFGGPTLIARRVDRGDLLWREEAADKGVGWGSPVADGFTVFAVNAAHAHRYNSSSAYLNDDKAWQVDLEAKGPGTLAPPAVEGATVWLHAPDSSYLRAVHKETGTSLFSLTMPGGGTYRMAGGGNRVFLVRGGRIAAMPVYGE